MADLEGKGEALLEWVQGWNGLVKLNAIITDSGELSLNIEPSAQPIDEFIDGSDRSGITFTLAGMYPYSAHTDTINVQAMALMEQWHDWVGAQYDLGNLPDFGNAVIDSIKPVNTVPAIAMVYDKELAKYQFSAEIIFCE